MPWDSLKTGVAAALAVLIACTSMVAGYWLRSLRADAEMAQVLHEASAETSRRVAAALRASEQARAEEARRAFEMERIVRDAQAKAEQARRDAAAADDAAGRLRQHVSRLAAQCTARGAAINTAPAAGGPPAVDPGVVLAELHGWTDQAAGELAQALDAARTAGLACERAYDSLTPTPR